MSAAIQTASKPMTLPGERLDASKMPGHWLLARMGKRVLRPGGIEMTRQMLDSLMISHSDTVVELAPGLGATARLTLQRRPHRYIAVERDAAAAARIRRLIDPDRDEVIHGNASSELLPSEECDVVYGEAMLTMQPPTQKHKIVREACRILRSGGRYAIHELGLLPDDVPERLKDEIHDAISEVIHVRARPLTVSEWAGVMNDEGLEVDVETVHTSSMHLLEPRRVIADEGMLRAARIAWNVARTPAARKRIFAMRRVFKRYEQHLCAVTMIGVKR